MNKILSFGMLISMLVTGVIQLQAVNPTACGPVPNENQLMIQEMESYAFIHFSLNTYTNQSWGYGDEDVKLFQPENLDCRQWARICKTAGLKGIIITAKHHCGFCLWPSAYTEFSVKNAPWKNGKGDVIRELADACKEYDLKLGIYLSPWDRNNSDYGKPEYISYFRNQLTELLTKYGPIFEVWFDGANGGNGYYGGANETRKIDRTTYYDWKNTYALIHKLQPKCAIWNSGGDRGDLRWVGTEDGYVGETNWSLMDSLGSESWNMLHYGMENGNKWVAAEVNTSIRPEWFYHPNEDDKVKTVPQLMDLYYNSIGRNGTMLLNFPVMPNGLIHPTDEKIAMEFGNAIKESFAQNLAADKKVNVSTACGRTIQLGAENVVDNKKETYWQTDDTCKTVTFNIDLGKPTLFNRFMAQEYIRLGQRVKSFNIEALIGENWKVLAEATTIGYKRILRFPAVKARQFRFTITDSKCSPIISNIGIYNAPLFLNAPAFSRNQSGEVTISSNDIGPFFYYTLDGSNPDSTSIHYTGPFVADGKVEVKAIAYDPATGKSGPIGFRQFDVSKKNWKLTGVTDTKANAIFDGDPTSVWHQKSDSMPVDLVIDLGNNITICGFNYLPDQHKKSAGIITSYEFYVSDNQADWKLIDKGEFANIKNNPILQVKTFAPVKARYMKLCALKNTTGDHVAGYAEVGVMTE
ncbi:MAG: alpha-L-fucosidase [Paludibacter sp.]|nr:alpha-L-fucosidase [Paludibacter sp.]